MIVGGQCWKMKHWSIKHFRRCRLFVGFVSWLVAHPDRGRASSTCNGDGGREAVRTNPQAGRAQPHPAESHLRCGTSRRGPSPHQFEIWGPKFSEAPLLPGQMAPFQAGPPRGLESRGRSRGHRNSPLNPPVIACFSGCSFTKYCWLLLFFPWYFVFQLLGA